MRRNTPSPFLASLPEAAMTPVGGRGSSFSASRNCQVGKPSGEKRAKAQRRLLCRVPLGSCGALRRLGPSEARAVSGEPGRVRGDLEIWGSRVQPGKGGGKTPRTRGGGCRGLGPTRPQKPALSPGGTHPRSRGAWEPQAREPPEIRTPIRAGDLAGLRKSPPFGSSSPWRWANPSLLGTHWNPKGDSGGHSQEV